MNVLSLFDGMSCGQVALERAGVKVENYYASEIDKYAIEITMKNYPNTIQLGDVENWREWDINWKSIDLLIGGSPCQGFSSAGMQLNFDDPRSKLFFVYVDILNHIKSVNPNVQFLLENVKMKSEWEEVITNALGVNPILIDSSLITAQMRTRLYWINFPVTFPKPRDVKLEDILESGYVDREKSYCIDANYYKGSNAKSYLEKRRRQVVILEPITDIEKQMNEGKFRKLTPVECERLFTLPDNYTEGVSNTQRYKMLGNGWSIDVVAHFFKGLRGVKWKTKTQITMV